MPSHEPLCGPLPFTRGERRRNRSGDPLVALHYQLADARHAGRVEALVLADDSGVVVAAAGPWATCEELAAYAPFLGTRDTGDGAFAEFRADVDVRAVDLGGQTVLLCARGGDARAAVMDRAAQGAVRILSQSARPL